MVRFGRYAAASAVGASAVVFHAFKSREQFYPAMLYLATSKISLVLLLNMALVVICAIWQLIKGLFLGPLREVEVERLNEQLWREVMEILFAMTVFRDEFNVSFVTTIIVLLFIKAFHWLAQTRVEYIETTPSVSRLSHVRIISFMALLLILDCVLFNHSFSDLLRTRRASVSLFFAFEYVILATATIATFVKYSLYLGDLFMEGQWDNKAVYVFYLELVRDLLHLSLYLFFFLVIFIHYGLPLHLVRELYETFRNFKTRVADFIRYRNITSNMNDRFPDATPEELGRSDATCIICREEMSTAKKLPCGHLFHIHCLRSWLERQQTCPTCRSSVLAAEAGMGAANPAAPHQLLQIEGRSFQGQGTGPQGEVNSGQAQGQASGNSSVLQERLYNAAVSAAAQYQSSFVYPTMRADNTNWYPAYVAFVPQAYVAAMTGASSTVQRSGGIESGGPVGTTGAAAGSLSGGTPSQVSHRWNQMRNGASSSTAESAAASWQYWPAYGYMPPTGRAVNTTDLPGSSQGAQVPGIRESSGHGMKANNVRSLPSVVNSPTGLRLQEAQLKQWKEHFEKQLELNKELQNELSSIRQETTTSSSVGNFRGKSVEDI
ncbi:E3 ubiquitin-protein ligase synoviolin [Marchantia polymorpha subsp. ruderalis]|uniref:RING-type E3 ubiquitin transferase n=2 Tax=Marchantia polymorpha TaxID=3197 RepID=A0AAF6ARH0_MARPO|nr:hypothetical protein MARPO_0001s0157 [Marchantia polymorpha]BBM99040.1 hypothetical protein Mp_1g18190 [Marchantia polymorpha subsp. ruderalis]|eukprot:PTQ50115.1 hypothetical protein MARPO_0001s0157 [Marchantia polymorpha]